VEAVRVVAPLHFWLRVRCEGDFDYVRGAAVQS
jgi:hypothetical protein